MANYEELFAGRDISQYIAVIGMAGSFPGAKNLDIFWDNIKNAKESITFFSDQQLKQAGISEELLKNQNYVKARGVLAEADIFDAKFFGYSPQEAALMDPQQRLFLQTAWEALENAGYYSNNYRGTIGVFAGTEHSTYLENNLLKNQTITNTVDSFERTIATGSAFVSTKTSYKLNLNGPSLNINTACSTSLVCIITACKHLLNYECDIALAGAASIEIPQEEGYLHQEGGIFSSDGHCRAFDANATGTVRGNGVAVVALKRLQDALVDGDHIDAIIIGYAINNDGANKAGYTAPSISGQANCIAEAIASAEIHPETIGYIESHGTATPVGDPIEIAALTQAFQLQTEQKQFCAIGSVKTNIGHTYSTAGIAGFIKAVLSLKNQLIPPSLHFYKANPDIDFANSPFYVNTELKAWNAKKQPRRAGVSSFGIGGTNVHLILEEAPKIIPANTARSNQIIILSAKTESALKNTAKNLAEYLQTFKEQSAPKLADIAFTLNFGRKEFNFRYAFACRNTLEAIQALNDFNDDPKISTISPNAKSSKLAFMFPGQGSQYINMGLELYQQEIIFRNAVDECCNILKQAINFDLRQVLFPPAEHAEIASRQLTDTRFTQPALFIIEYSLAKLLIHWGIEPTLMIGHSIGEYVAAHLAGVFSLVDALLLVVARGQLISQIESGSMLAVSLSEQDLTPLLSESVSLAAINAPKLCVVSGKHEAIENFLKLIAQKFPDQEIRTRLLHTSHAFHSTMIDAIVEQFEAIAANVKFNRPSIPIVSNLSGKIINAHEISTPAYWAKHLRHTVRFSDGIAELIQQGCELFIEVGPGDSLSTFVKQHWANSLRLTTIAHAKEAAVNPSTIYHSLAKLWQKGIKINWPNFYVHEKRHRVALPTYPFEGERYWIEPDTSFIESPRYQQMDYPHWFYQPSWQRTNQLANTEINLPADTNWLIFADQFGLADAIKKYLIAKKQVVFQVKPGKKFSNIKNNYTINPKSKLDYDELIRTIYSQSNAKLNILHLWNITAATYIEPSLDYIKTSQYLSFYSLLFCSQAINSLEQNIATRILVVTDHLHYVTGNEIIQPEKATIIGPCRVIPSEQPNIEMFNIDIELHASGNYKNLANSLISEIINYNNSKTKLIAYRNEYKWLETVLPYNLPINKKDTPLKQRGVYLITGGLGGIGLTFAELLAEKAKANIILISRSDFPPEYQWENLAIDLNNSNNPIKTKIHKLLRINQLANSITIIKADVTDEQEMSDIINQSLHKFKKINGIIHTAGIESTSLSQFKRLDEVENTFSAKIYGTFLLSRLLKNIPLDFLVLCSSISAKLGILGQVDYCAANSYMDFLAESQQFSSINNVISINWNSWKDVGMTTRAKGKAYMESISRLNHISSTEGKNILLDALNSNTKQLTVSKIKFNEFNTLITQLTDTAISDRKSSDRVKISTTNSENTIETHILNYFSKILGTSKITLNANFFELGGDSLLALKLISNIQNEFKIKINLTDLYATKTVSAIAKLIENKQIKSIQNQSNFIFKLNQGAEESPVFFVHPMGGFIHFYVEIAKLLDTARPIYAIQDPQLHDKSLQFTSLNEMASYYLTEIKKIQPQGPYSLAGWSLGGVIAFAMAHQLLSQGEKIEFLGLIDSWAEFPSFDLAENYFEQSRLMQQEIWEKQLKNSTEISDKELLALLERHKQLLINFKPPLIDTKITLFKAEELLPEYQLINDEYNHWSKYCKQAINLYHIPGNHNTLMVLPHVKKLAKIIKEMMESPSTV